MKLTLRNLNRFDAPDIFDGFVSAMDQCGDQLWEFPVSGEKQWVVAARIRNEDNDAHTWISEMDVLARWFVNDSPEDYVNHRVK